MNSGSTFCKDCGLELATDSLAPPREPCPRCDSTVRRCIEDFHEGLAACDSLRLQSKKPSLPSRKKLRFDGYSGVEHSRKHEKLVRVERTIDKDNDLYTEKVVDLNTREILHECVEPLSKHQGHGSAKQKKP